MPALQLLPANPAASNEVWDILVHYHYEVRYRLYYQWKTSQKYPALIVSRAEAANEAKKLLRYVTWQMSLCSTVLISIYGSRISTDNVRSIGRQLGRITHSAPFPPFEQILGQIQTYTNIIKPVVDTVKYVSNLTCDVLSCKYSSIDTCQTHCACQICCSRSWCHPPNKKSKKKASALLFGCRGCRNFVAIYFKSSARALNWSPCWRTCRNRFVPIITRGKCWWSARSSVTWPIFACSKTFTMNKYSRRVLDQCFMIWLVTRVNSLNTQFTDQFIGSPKHKLVSSLQRHAVNSSPSLTLLSKSGQRSYLQLLHNCVLRLFMDPMPRHPRN